MSRQLRLDRQDQHQIARYLAEHQMRREWVDGMLSRLTFIPGSAIDPELYTSRNTLKGLWRNFARVFR